MEGTYQIEVADIVHRQDLAQLDETIKTRVLTAMRDKLMVAPEHFGKPLRYALKKARSLRVGNYRIIFLVKGKTVFVAAIFHRSSGYESIVTRLEKS